MSTISIILTQGQVTIIDESDAERVNQHKWWAMRTPSGYYAATKIRDASGKRRVVQMQRFLLDEPVGFHVDHISGDTLDNRRTYNLRLATRSQNKANGRAYANNSSGFKGVYWAPRHKKWHAQIRHARHLYDLGYFDCPEDAARAYDAKAREVHGPFARCNFPAAS